MTFFHFCAYAHDLLGFKIDIFKLPDNHEPRPKILTVYRFEKKDKKAKDSYVFTLDPTDADWKKLAASAMRNYKKWQKADYGVINQNRKNLRAAILQQLLYDYCEVGYRKTADGDLKAKHKADAEACIAADCLAKFYPDEWPQLKDVLLGYGPPDRRKVLKKILENTPSIVAGMTGVID